MSTSKQITVSACTIVLLAVFASATAEADTVDIATRESPDFSNLRKLEGNVPAIMHRCRETVPGQNGHSRVFKDESGREWTFRQLFKVSELMHSGTDEELLQLFTFLRDPSAHIRYIAACAIKRRLKKPENVDWESIIIPENVNEAVSGILKSCLAENVFATRMENLRKPTTRRTEQAGPAQPATPRKAETPFKVQPLTPQSKVRSR